MDRWMDAKHRGRKAAGDRSSGVALLVFWRGRKQDRLPMRVVVCLSYILPQTRGLPSFPPVPPFLLTGGFPNTTTIRSIVRATRLTPRQPALTSQGYRSRPLTLDPSRKRVTLLRLYARV